MKRFIFFALLSLLSLATQAQQAFTRADSLRGMLSPARQCYDVSRYHLSLNVNTTEQTITGFNVISYNVVNPFDSLQIDLFGNLTIDSIVHKTGKLRYRRDGNAVFVKFSSMQKQNDSSAITVFYHGRPLPAKRAPWDGGFVWRKDVNGKTWLGTACQGTGASSWWPCKDHQSDEPESMRMDFTVPDGLVCVSNGKLTNVTDHPDATTTWTWKVSYPINNYNVTLNLADYAHINDYYTGINGDTLKLDYYVMKYNEAQARQHFQQVKTMLGCFERCFGPYPFYRDGYKLVESTYWGMEHQSAIAYGNAFRNSPHGFDFIIVHESAHEWWGNLLSCADNADMWLHESFGTYAEALYMECRNDYNSNVRYMEDIRWQIADKHPIIGPYNVNFSGTENDNDMYFKGAWVIHTFRSQLQNDSLFFSILQGLLKEFGYKSTNSDEVIAYIVKRAGEQYKPFFDQYLRFADPPRLLMTKKKKNKGTELSLRWQTNVSNFVLNVEAGIVATPYIYTAEVSSEKTTTLFIPDAKPRVVGISKSRYYFRM